MTKLSLSQWWNVLSEFLLATSCPLFEGVHFTTDKYGLPAMEKNGVQDFGANDGID